MTNKDMLIKFLEWMYKTTRETPMRLETDNDDIVAMFLSENKINVSHDFFPVLEENYQAQIAGYYNHDKTPIEREKRNAVIKEYEDLIAIYKNLNKKQ